MRILVNATNLRVGGGVQKAVEFVRASMVHPNGHEFSYALSDVVRNNLQGLMDVRNRDLWVADVSPSRPLSGRRTRRALHDLERRFRPDVAYSVFGPTYTKFRSPHLMGFAMGWVTHPNRYAWRTLKSPLAKARYWLRIRQAAFWAQFADRWVLETAVAADGLSRVLGVGRDRCHVIPNVCAEQYYQACDGGLGGDVRLAKRDALDFNLLVFASWYPHKNLELVPQVAQELRKRDATRRCRFFLTVDQASPAWTRIHDRARSLGVGDDVINLGTVPVAGGPALYRSADALFLPTLLESFTASYPEAMCMRRPIVTTDLPFAREICGDAATYFDPNGAGAAAESILALARDEALRQELVVKGERRLESSKTPREVYEMFLELLELTARQ